MKLNLKKAISLAFCLIALTASPVQAGPCDDLEKAKALGAYCAPKKPKVNTNGMFLSSNGLKKSYADAPANIAKAAEILQLSTPPTTKQIRTIERGMFAAYLLKDNNNMVTFGEGLQLLSGKSLSESNQKYLAGAYFNVGRFEESHTLNKKWVPSARHISNGNYKNIIIAADYANDYAFAAKQTEALLVKTKKKYKSYNKQAQLHFDMLRYNSLLGVRDSLEAHTDKLSELLNLHFKKEPLSRAHYLNKSSQLLNEAGFTDLGRKMASQMGGEEIANLNEHIETHQSRCEANSPQSCLDLANIYKSENALQDKKLYAAQRACELGAPEGCFLEATFHLYGLETEKNEAKAHAMFVRACADSIGDACHGAAIEFIQSGPTPDLEKARSFYKTGCNYDSGRSCHSLANSFNNPRDKLTKSDPKKARKYYKKACKLGQEFACIAARR
ncbi:MAG: hypothetical protein ABJG88_07105 [Litorimonas sp.]